MNCSLNRVSSKSQQKFVEAILKIMLLNSFTKSSRGKCELFIFDNTAGSTAEQLPLFKKPGWTEALFKVIFLEKATGL